MSRSVSVGPSDLWTAPPEPIQRRGGGCGAACIPTHRDSRRSRQRRWRRPTSGGEGICGTWASSPGPLVDFSMSCESPIPNSAQPSTKQLLPASGATRVRSLRIYGSLLARAVEPLVLEHTPRLTVVEATFGWSDLGRGTDVHDARVAAGRRCDADGPRVSRTCVHHLAAHGCTVISRSGRIVAVARYRRCCCG